MKTCEKCGCKIENGVNGCMIMNECFRCHGGYPKYPKTEKKPFGWNLTEAEIDGLESRCIRDYE